MRKVCGIGINYMRGRWRCGHPRDYQEEYQVRVYRLWMSMIRRCYSENSLVNQPSYRSCQVCVRWRKFSNFIKDLPNIPNYSLWLNSTKTYDYALDKEFYRSCKVYHPRFVGFTTVSDNSRERMIRLGSPMEIQEVKDLRSHTVIGILESDSNDVVIYNPASSCTKDGYSFGNVSSCCRGRLKHYKGRIWKYL